MEKDLTEILGRSEIDTRELLTSLYYPGNKEVANMILNIPRNQDFEGRYQRENGWWYPDPMPSSTFVALNEAKAAKEQNNQIRFDEMIKRASKCIIEEKSPNLEKSIETIDQDPEVVNSLLNELLSKKEENATYWAFKIAKKTGDLKRAEGFIELCLSQGGSLRHGISFFEDIKNEKRVRELRERELGELIKNESIYSVNYAIEHFPERVKETALEIVTKDSFMRRGDEDKWQIYHLLGDELPENLHKDRKEVKKRMLHELNQKFKKFMKEDYPDLFYFNILTGKERDDKFIGLISNQQLARVYHKTVSYEPEREPERKADIAFEGYQKTRDTSLLSLAMRGYITCQNYQKVLECAKILGNADKMNLYGAIVKMIEEKNSHNKTQGEK